MVCKGIPTFMSEKVKILFLFNQILDDHSFAGGEIRGINIFKLFKNDPSYEVSVMIPKVSETAFLYTPGLFTGKSFPEKLIYKKNINRDGFIIFLLYCLRTLESVKYAGANFRVVYSTGDFFCNTFFAFLFKLFHPQSLWVNCVHHINESPLRRKSSSLANSLVSFLSQNLSFVLMKTNGNLIIVTNSLVEENLIGCGFRPKDIVVAGNGLDIDYIKKVAEEFRDKNPRNRICYFGRLNLTKGILDLPKIFIKVLKVYPSYYLDIVGDAEEEFLETVKREFLKYGCLDKVVFHGFLGSREEVFKVVLRSKVVIIPSYEEGWCLSLFEAAILEKPIIAYKLPVFKEMFTGALKMAEIGNTKEFSDLVLEVIDPNNREQVNFCIKKCYQISSKYEWGSVFEVEKKSLESLL